MCSKQEENPSESIFYKEQFKGLSEDLNDGFGPYINVKTEHEKILLRLNEEIKTYGLRKLIIKVDEENFFSDEYCDKKILVIKEFILIPRLLKLNVGYFDIYMVRDKNYKTLFRFGLFDYSYYYVDVPYFIKYVRIYIQIEFRKYRKIYLRNLLNTQKKAKNDFQNGFIK